MLGSAPPGTLRHVVTHLLTPLLMCVGMGLAYLGAFAQPEPHQLPVAIVGSGTQVQALAQELHDKTGDALDVRTLPDRAAAEQALKARDIAGAYLPGSSNLLVATAGSDTSATATEKVFTPVAEKQGEPLHVTDVVPPADGDPTGQGVFFLLVALSIGAYASVAVLGAAGGALPMRIRALFVAGTSFVVSLIGTAFAGPVFHLVDDHLWGLWAMAWMYAAGILFLGIGLHTFLKRWTTLGVMVLFVMLNFTSSGGIFRPELQNGFFGALHSFWNGAGFVEGVRSLVYFGGHDLARNVWTLAIWLTVGVAAVTASGIVERRRKAALVADQAGADSVRRQSAVERRNADELAAEEEEMEEAVAV
ncbi:hypothetical protein H9Y04_21350 [Streptomyces sp. TRM66268-LWL]|uniref:ABC transporter permease n=1 Tax=Streptomyces polyasparticus TaxID=2767826 RepID=A0ABR7SHV2_9ACTN|nr:hypothetical protein [Streptomyces polyasparticus]MBC9715101.1 hypothetical protein [Streptomyces polyasparticus]